jgi:hypothetical protein
MREAILVGALVFATRVPFLAAGYGWDLDAWRLANTASAIAATGAYEASRLPGHPVQEYLCALLSRGGPLALNGATALLSAAGAALFALSWGRLGGRHAALAAIAFALTPGIFLNSTNSMDYVWAIAFLLAAHHFLLAGRPLVAGALLGLATGCRLTSAAFVAPFALIAMGPRPPREAAAGVVRLCAGALVVGGLAFVPVLLRYGWGLLFFHDPGRPKAGVVFARGMWDVWGTTGALALGLALLSAPLRGLVRGKDTAIPAGVAGTGARAVAAWVLAIGLTAIVFLRLPHEGAYLLPAVPFVLLLLGRAAPRRAFLVGCLGLCLAPFASLGRGGVSAGPILIDRARRAEDARAVGVILDEVRGLPPGSVVAAGHWSLLLGSPPRPAGSSRTDPEEETVRFVVYPEREELRDLKARGVPVYYLPGVSERAMRAKRYSIEAEGARPLFPDWKERGFRNPPAPIR